MDIEIPADDDERGGLADALRELLASRGWQWLSKYAADHYGPAGYGRQINAAISAIPAGPDRPYEIAHVTEKVHASCEAVNVLMKRPQDVLSSLTKKSVPRRFDHFRRTLETHR